MLIEIVPPQCLQPGESFYFSGDLQDLKVCAGMDVDLHRSQRPQFFECVLTVVPQNDKK